jgi:hypothetical protein
MGLGLADYDNDGDMDMYVANYDNTANVLLENQSGVFVDATTPELECALSSYGAAWGDYDNDGDLDLYVNNEGPGNLLRNDDGVFTDVTAYPLDDGHNGRSVAWGDYDLDGDLDLYVVNNDGANRLLSNNGDGTFDKTICGTYVIADTQPSFGAAWGDYDKDGDLDMYVVNDNPRWSTNRLVRNELGSGNHWLEVDPVGVFSNTSGIGVRVRVVVGGVSQMREVTGASGFASQGPLTARFGLGTETVVDTVEVTWPASGAVQIFTSLGCDQTIEVVEVDVAGVVDKSSVPAVFKLHPNRPNPFSSVTTIRYDLPEIAQVDLTIYNVSGRVVCRLLDRQTKEPGRHTVYWNGLNRKGVQVAPGIYFVRMAAGSRTQTQRMLLLR